MPDGTSRICFDSEFMNLAVVRVIPGRDEGRNKGWENLVYTAEVQGIETRTD
jgi:hypothetical protein